MGHDTNPRGSQPPLVTEWEKGDGEVSVRGGEVRDGGLGGCGFGLSGGGGMGGREELREEVTNITVIKVPTWPRSSGAHTYLIGSVVKPVEAQVSLRKRRC